MPYSLEELKEMVGNREGESTSAIGSVEFADEDVLFVAKQGGSFSMERVSKHRGPRKGGPIDARDYVVTSRNKGEWAGYHAEMIIISGVLGFLFEQCSTYFDKSVALQTQTIKIVADAPCCKHCHNMLNFLGVNHPTPQTIKTALFYWWNPLNDKRASNGFHKEFADNIPFHEI